VLTVEASTNDDSDQDDDDSYYNELVIEDNDYDISDRRGHGSFL
jgi:hypothetical protein